MKIVSCTGRNGGSYTLDCNIADLADSIARKQPLIVRSLVSADEVECVRSLCAEWSLREEPSNPPVTRSSKNYHRINLNPERSSVKSVNHVYRFFYWDENTNPVAAPFARAMRLRNVLSNLDVEYAQNEITDGFVSMPFVSHYPRGGGYLQEHQDPVSRQKAVVIVNLSRLGDDFTSGGLYFLDEAEGNAPVHVDPLMEPGDAFVFHPQTPHGVRPIDPDVPLDLSRTDGRWMFTSSLVSLGSLNGTDYANAGQPRAPEKTSGR